MLLHPVREFTSLLKTVPMEKQYYIKPAIEALPAQPDAPLLAASSEDEEVTIIYPGGTQPPIDDKNVVW